ncbi:rRNA methylase [Liquorilactobacillus sucicola DSM 21376 = JCM 15457]|uniref:23S rRNA methyltransferase n=1 Tax=Liquorilactobacillus sucicola DSM 21376 = JCM 15457 TaxID=1423806 RepID=A0A023CV04_9LACO|nr:RNA methyltransferase [Liquorilactobacillus sucicola]KRN05309.1 23S rRNA methyltransferase [Liquorilactobacillus sucicola DSM 21376 = JCM 15457]GAJ25375.1 rRNA methylase [Liquorilactobacillus sucicola DSM 21376 = JCM 15457]
MKVIRSVQNKQVKEWKKLSTKKGRKKQNAYLLDGWHLVKEALAARSEIKLLLVTEDFKYRAEFEEMNTQNSEEIIISEEVAKHLSETPSPQGIFGVIALKKEQSTPVSLQGGAWLMLDSVQDPGNIGTMVRTADAAGFTGVIFGVGTADVYQPKVVRAMQGSQFHIKLITASLSEWIQQMHKENMPVFGTELNPAAKPYDEVGKYRDFAIVMGNEGNGMSEEILSTTTTNLYIPIKGHAESLNVAVAAGILMFQLKR